GIGSFNVPRDPSLRLQRSAADPRALSRSRQRLRSPGEGRDRRGPRHQETTMPKYLLLKHYRGGPEPHKPCPPMDQWAPEDVEAHIAFMKHVTDLLERNGEYVDV